MIRRYGEPLIRGQSYRRRPGVYAILERGGQLLLTYQDAPHYEFQLPGGGIERGENPVTALHREVFEETGWHISTPRRMGAYRRFVFMPEYGLWAEKLCHIYVARPISRIGPPSEAGHEAVWMAPDLALDLLANSGDRAFVAGLLGQG